MHQLIFAALLFLPLTVVPAPSDKCPCPGMNGMACICDNHFQPVDGGGEVDQPAQQTTTIDSKIVAIAVDYHAALLLACSDLIHRKDVPAVEKCAKYYLTRIIQSDKSRKEK